MTRVMAVMCVVVLIGSICVMAGTEGEYGSTGLLFAGLLFIATNIGRLLEEMIYRLKMIEDELKRKG